MWIYFASGLPSSQSLLAYQPPLPTNVRGYDGTPVQTFARERRVELAYDEFPPLVLNAFISAEDKTFFSHGGIDYIGLVGAVGDYAAKTVTGGGRARGGSTITQQVAKYLLKDFELQCRAQDPRGDPRLPPRIDAVASSRSSSSTSIRSSSAATLMASRPRRAPISTRTSAS